MTKVLVKKTIDEDIQFLIDEIREPDKIELEAAAGSPYYQVIRDGYKQNAHHSWTGHANNNVVAVFGIKRLTALSDVGVPWLISTNLVPKYRGVFMRYSKQIFDLVKRDYNYLCNYVDKRNIVAIRWLKWLGFTIQEPEPYGVNGELFCRFELTVSKISGKY